MKIHDKHESEAWNKGYQAFLDGKRDDDSPYEEDSTEDEEWLAGWQQADWNAEQSRKEI